MDLYPDGAKLSVGKAFNVLFEMFANFYFADFYFANADLYFFFRRLRHDLLNYDYVSAKTLDVDLGVAELYTANVVDTVDDTNDFVVTFDNLENYSFLKYYFFFMFDFIYIKIAFLEYELEDLNF
jgi:hypothetical protein